MMHFWMNLIAAILVTSPAAENCTTQEMSEHAVVERVNAHEVIVETARGNFHLPRHFLPEELENEGAVFVIRIDNNERAKRIELAKNRIERIKSQSSADAVIEI